MYRYFYIRTDCFNNTWNTTDIEKYIEDTGCFRKDGTGSYIAHRFFCSLQIMLVNNWDCWSSDDYDSKSANYISIVTTDMPSDLRNSFLKKLSLKLGFRVLEDH